MAHTLPSDLTSSYGLMEGMARWAYDVTHGAFWSLMLLGFCFVLFVATSRFNTTRALNYAAVSGMLGAIFLASISLMPWWIASAFILAGAIAIAASIMQGKG